MGKRKSKISKQKQAKAAAKSLKSRVIKEQQVQVVKQPYKNKKNGKRRSSSSMLTENDDYKRQQVSMQERHLAEEQQRNATAIRKRGKTNNNKLRSSFQFQAPTLIVDDAKKSTTQLMSEVTSKTQGWDGIGTVSYTHLTLPTICSV